MFNTVRKTCVMKNIFNITCTALEILFKFWSNTLRKNLMDFPNVQTKQTAQSGIRTRFIMIFINTKNYMV